MNSHSGFLIWILFFFFQTVTKSFYFLCQSRLLLQVSTEASRQANEMSMAFGCTLKDCRHLLETAKELGVQVVGVR